MIKMDTIPIFSTPILVADFEKHNEYKDKFVDVPKFERKPKTWIAPVNTSFPQVRPGDDVMPDGIKEDILENVKRIMSRLLLLTDFKKRVQRLFNYKTSADCW